MSDFIPKGYRAMAAVFERCAAEAAPDPGRAFRDEVRQRLWDGRLIAYVVDGAVVRSVAREAFADEQVWRGLQLPEIWSVFDGSISAKPLLVREDDIARLLSGLVGTSAPTPPPHEASTRPSSSGRPSPAAAAVKAWYSQYVTQCEAACRRPSREDDAKAAAEHFGRRVNRELLRECRRRLAPNAWREPVRKSKSRA